MSTPTRSMTGEREEKKLENIDSKAQRNKEANEDASSPDYMSEEFVEVSTRTAMKRRHDPLDDDDEDFVSASLFSTAGQITQRAEPFSKLDYEEEEAAARQEENDEAEDYMSERFLASMKDVKPGIQSTHNYQRMLKLSANREAAEAPRPKMKKGELEKQRLHEGLSKPIDQQSKGYELLAKMGFKPGMSLGKKRTDGVEDKRISEPVAIQTQFISSRIGLGHREEEKARQKERCELHLKEMAKRANNEETLTGEFLTRKRGRDSQRQLVGDLIKCRKVCEDLDLRKDYGTPVVEWFWPSYSDARQEQPDEDEREMGRRMRRVTTTTTSTDPFGLEQANAKFVYSNGREAPPNPDFNQMAEQELQDSLEYIVSHLRSVHFYCTWCGCAYDSREDLEYNCPGRMRQDHEE